MERVLTHPKAIADLGEKIYQERHRAAFEAEHMGQFVVIDVTTEKAYVAQTAEGAYEMARRAAPGGLFHLLRVGAAGAFRVSYSADSQLDWIFR